jgi:O-antigen ligase
MTEERFIDKAIFRLSMLGVFLLPSNFLVPPVIALLFVAWLCSGRWKEKAELFRQSKLSWLFLALGVLYITGFFWSANRAEAVSSIVVKLSVFAFPVVFGTTRFDYIKTKRILQSLLAGLIAVGVFMIVRSLFTNADPNVDVWSYQQLSRELMHPSYLSLYYVIGVMICFHGILLRDVPVNKKALAVAFVLFFCILIFMLASKTGIISLVLIFLFYIGYAVVRFRRYVVAGAALLVLVIGFFASLQVFPSLKERLNTMTEVIASDKPIDPSEVESNRVRLLIWQQDLQLISEHPLTGVGTGDVQDELMKKYSEAGMTGAQEKRLNAHSQYFQTGIALGLPGLVLLCGIFLAAFTVAVRRRYGFAALLTVLLAFNFIPESMLQLQAGTFLFGFFFSFILFAADTAVISPKAS